MNMNSQNEPQMLLDSLLVEPEISRYMYKLSVDRPAVFVHSRNVAYLVAEIFHISSKSDSSLFFKTNDEDVKDIIRGALLHDIGKLGIPEEVLNKKDALTEREIQIIRSHPKLGYDMIRGNERLSTLTKDIVLHHHEKLDGSGYPDGLRTIPSAIQIVTLCDMYDALTENRPYRPQKTIFTAYQILDHESVDKELFMMLQCCHDR